MVNYGVRLWSSHLENVVHKAEGVGNEVSDRSIDRDQSRVH